MSGGGRDPYACSHEADASDYGAASGHGPGHAHGDHSQCDHAHEPSQDELEDSLYAFVDKDKMRGYNVMQGEDQVAQVCKSWDQRRDTSLFVDSDCDDEMILFVPFVSVVKVKKICIRGGEDGMCPRSCRIFVNREDIDFENAEEMPADQVLEMADEHRQELDYPTKVALFRNVQSLTMFFKGNFGADISRLYYLGFKGEHTDLKRQIVEAVYEARPQASDHEVKNETFMPHHM